MIELKWIVPDVTTTLSPRLLYRAKLDGVWGEWLPVPKEVVPAEQFFTAGNKA